MKMTRRARRMAQRHRAGASLQVVSLMNIFTILLFFLLVHAGDPVAIQPPPDIKLPHSTASKPTEQTPVLLVDTSGIRRDDGSTLAWAEFTPEAGQALAARLKAELPPDAPERVTLVGDKHVPYARLKPLLKALADAGLAQVKLAVLEPKS